MRFTVLRSTFCKTFSRYICDKQQKLAGADLGGGCRGCAPPPPEITCGFLIQLVFCKKKKTLWFIGDEVEQETSAPPPKKNPGSAPRLPLVDYMPMTSRWEIQN